MKSIVTRMRRELFLKLRRSGISIMKAPGVGYEPLPVFRLAVEMLMQIKGNSLRFIQVGANDGVYGDPIRPYILGNGWSGILVEPQIDVYNRLKQNYTAQRGRLIFENVAIGTGPGLALYRPPASLEEGQGVPHGLTVVSSDPEVVSRQTGIPKQRLEKIQVQCITLDELVEKHAYQGFDVLQIDVEGFDLDVLFTLSLEQQRPGLIQFEHGHLDRMQLASAADHLTRHRYKLYYGGRDSNDSVAMPYELFE